MAEWYEEWPVDWWFAKDHVTEEQAAFIRKALHLRTGQEVLDAPCGDGQVAIRLARRGVLVTGVDFLEKFIRRARRRFRKEALSGSFHVADLRELAYEGRFHAVCNWFNSFGYFSDDENRDVLRRFVCALRPGGRLLIEQFNREWVLRHLQPRREGDDWTAVTEWNARTQRIEMVGTSTCGGKTQTGRCSHRVHTLVQFGRLFARAGLTVEAMYGDWDGSEHSRSSRRLVMVGRKQ